jgi:hypothetical protein
LILACNQIQLTADLKRLVPASCGLATAPEEIKALSRGLQVMKNRIEAISLSRSAVGGDAIDHVSELHHLIMDLDRNKSIPFHWTPLGPEKGVAPDGDSDMEEATASQSMSFQERLSELMPERIRSGLWDRPRRKRLDHDSKVELQLERSFDEGDVVVVKADLAEETKAALTRKKRRTEVQPKRFWLAKVQKFIGDSQILVHWYEGTSEFGQYRLLYRPPDKSSRSRIGPPMCDEIGRNTVLFSFSPDFSTSSSSSAPDALYIPREFQVGITRALELEASRIECEDDEETAT